MQHNAKVCSVVTSSAGSRKGPLVRRFAKTGRRRARGKGDGWSGWAPCRPDPGSCDQTDDCELQGLSRVERRDRHLLGPSRKIAKRPPVSMAGVRLQPVQEGSGGVDLGSRHPTSSFPEDFEGNGQASWR